MSKIAIVLLMLMVAFNSYAAIDCVVVYDKDGNQSIIPIKEASEIKFDAQTMSVGTYEFIIDNIKRYEFADASNLGIEEIIGDISGCKIDPIGLITFSEPITKEVGVYNTQGFRLNVSPKGNVIDLTQLPSDVYFVKIGHSSIKFIKK